ncbi:MFS transporter [Corynebacterium sp. HMSC04H06]|uniref:MFS transporter n=1 Tax=Corynebacterium sp. HMSC04H06 TaxID=1581050 RepID=UPI002696D083
MLSTASMSPPKERGRALAFVVTGLTVATIFGVPAAQAVGDAVGWKTAFGIVAGLAAVALALLWVVMPHMTLMPATSLRTEFSALANRQVWLTLAIGVVGFGGMFAVYTYITWVMTERAGLGAGWMWLILMLFGLGMTAGNWLGGRLADWNVERGLVLCVGLLCISLLAFYFASTAVVPAIVTFMCIGVFGMALQPLLQVRLLDYAGKAQTLAAALNQSALNTANAAGAALGGAVVGAGWGYGSPALAGAVLAAIAVGIWALAQRAR